MGVLEKNGKTYMVGERTAMNVHSGGWLAQMASTKEVTNISKLWYFLR